MTGPSRGGRPKRRVPSERSDVNRAQLLVFVEGLCTEVQYINFWYRMNRAPVLVEIDERHGTPMTLVNAALDAERAEQREERRNRGKAHDEYWCVFDRDEHPQFDEAIKLARENGIGIAMSNPCLELWFVWHFADHTAHVGRGVGLRSISAVARASRARPWRSSPKAGGMTPQRSARWTWTRDTRVTARHPAAIRAAPCTSSLIEFAARMTHSGGSAR